MTALTQPRHGAVAYFDTSGERQEFNPHDPMFSTATMLATQYWTGDCWQDIFVETAEEADAAELGLHIEVVEPAPAPAPVPHPDNAPVELSLTHEESESLYGQLTDHGQALRPPLLPLPPLPDSPVEFETSPDSHSWFTWTSLDLGGTVMFHWGEAGLSFGPIVLPDRNTAQLVNELFKQSLAAGHAQGVTYAKQRMFALLSELTAPGEPDGG